MARSDEGLRSFLRFFLLMFGGGLGLMIGTTFLIATGPIVACTAAGLVVGGIISAFI